MKILFKSLRQGEVKVKVEDLDDLWYLSQILDEGDLVKGQTFRKVKVGEKEEGVRRSVFIELKVEKLEFGKHSPILRVGGSITQAPEDIPRGSHHTFSVEEHSIISITKNHWPKFQLDRLEEASTELKSKILICIFDREDAIIALLKKYGYDILAELKGAVQKKAETVQEVRNFYEEIVDNLKEYSQRYKAERILLASPSFWKEELLKNLKDDELRAKFVLATCSSVDHGAISEVLKRSEVQELLKQERAAKEMKLVEELMKEIAPEGNSAYGIKESDEAATVGAVRTLLITDGLIMDSRQSGKYIDIERIMKSVERASGDVHIVSSDHDAGKRLDGLGGIGAILRYKYRY